MHAMNMRNFAKLKQDGAVLLEALIAILIFSVGILGIVALQSNMILATGEAHYRAQATFLAQQQLSDTWNSPNAINLSCGATVDAPANAGLPAGTITTVCGCDNRQECRTIIVNWTHPATGTVHSVTTRAYVTRDNAQPDFVVAP